MALPKLNTPTYELEMPSTDEKIQFRPFLVKEEKILLMAMETEKNQDIIRAVKDIVSECTFNKVDFSNVPMFDTEYVFLQIRSKFLNYDYYVLMTKRLMRMLRLTYQMLKFKLKKDILIKLN